MTTTGDARDRLAGFDRARFDGQLQLHSEGPPSQGFRHIGRISLTKVAVAPVVGGPRTYWRSIGELTDGLIAGLVPRIEDIIAEPRDCLAEQGSDDRPCH